jgi:hypothetical protein
VVFFSYPGFLGEFLKLHALKRYLGTFGMWLMELAFLKKDPSSDAESIAS